jgi:hypothetical protein
MLLYSTTISTIEVAELVVSGKSSNSSSQTSDTNHDEFSFSLSLIPIRAVPNGVHLMQLGLNYLLHSGPAILGFGLVDLFLLGLRDIAETGSMSVTIT